MMTTRWGMWGLGVVLALAIVGCDSQPKGTPLQTSGIKLAVKVGDTHRVKMLREEVLVHGSVANKTRVSRHLGVDVTFHVAQVDPDGTAKVQLVFNSGIYKQGGEAKKDDDLPPIFKSYAKPGNALANVKGQMLLLTIAPDFTLMSLEGDYDSESESGLVAVIASEYSLPSEATKNDALGEFAQSERRGIGFSVGRQIVSDVLDLFPIGFYDRGKDSVSLDALGLGFVRGPDCTWMVENMNVPTVTAKTLAKFDTAGGGADAWSPITFELSGTKKGTLQIDKAKGWIVSGRIEEAYSGKKVVRMGEKQRLTFPADFKRITKFEKPGK